MFYLSNNQTIFQHNELFMSQESLRLLITSYPCQYLVLPCFNLFLIDFMVQSCFDNQDRVWDRCRPPEPSTHWSAMLSHRYTSMKPGCPAWGKKPRLSETSELKGSVEPNGLQSVRSMERGRAEPRLGWTQLPHSHEIWEKSTTAFVAQRWWDRTHHRESTAPVNQSHPQRP